MKKYLLPMLAVLLCATACKKDEEGLRLLTATIEPYENDSKAYVDNQNYACWESNDSVRINGTAYAITVNGQASRASIDLGENPPSGALTAFYPASLISNNMQTVTLPAVQHYVARNGHQVIQSPMAAYCAADGTELAFRNLGALLKVTLPSHNGDVVKRIMVKGRSGQMLCGTAQLLRDNSKFQLSAFHDGQDSVTLEDINVALTSAQSFYIVVPAYSVFDELTIQVFLKTSDGGISIARKTNSTFGKILDRSHIGAFSYNLDGTVHSYSANKVVLYTTTDGTEILPENMLGISHHEYGILVYRNDVNSWDDDFAGKANLSTITLPASVTTIWENAFQNCTGLTSITIPSGVTGIWDNAFRNCSSLTSITIPSGVNNIRNAAFQNCASLTSITIPAGVTEIWDSTFQNCSSLASVTMLGNVTKIGLSAFKDCASLTSFTIPAGVTEINKNVFEGCTSLASVTIPSGVTEIWQSAFKGCTSLTSITIPAGVTEIDFNVFEDCSSLASVTMLGNVTSIQQSAFKDCSSLTSITIPAGVTEIDMHVFEGCTSLASVTMLGNVTKIRLSAFDNCSSLTTIPLPSSLTYIDAFAFRNCSSLTSITLPNNLTTIESSAFEESGLTSITLPASLTSIGSFAFQYCSHLTDVYVNRDNSSGITTGGYKMFDDCSTLQHIYVPSGSVDAYQAADHWSSYADKISAPSSKGRRM